MNPDKNDFPLITIGIPIVKSDYLLDTLKLALSQTYSNLEIVILNNAPTNERRDKIRDVVKKTADPRILYHENEAQLPIIENWNKTFSLARGEFFAILCDDDNWDKEFISKLYLLSIKYPDCNVFHSRTAIINEHNKIIRIAPLCNEFEDVLDFMWHRLKGYREQFLSDFLVKTNALKLLGGFFALPGAWGSDDITWYGLAKNNGIAFSSDILFYYRENEQSVTNTMSLKSKIKACQIASSHLSLFVQNCEVLNDFDEIKKANLVKLIPKHYNGEIRRWQTAYYNKKYHLPRRLINLTFKIKGSFLQ